MSNLTTTIGPARYRCDCGASGQGDSVTVRLRGKDYWSASSRPVGWLTADDGNGDDRNYCSLACLLAWVGQTVDD